MEEETLSSNKAPALSKIGYVVILAVIMLLVLALIYLWAPAAPPIQPSATKLVIEAPLEAKVGSTIAVTVKAVDEDGRVDKTRNDIVEISITPEGLTDLSKIKVRLEGGEATVSFTVKASGKAVIQAKWIQGYSFLKTGSTSIQFT
jgi:type II secretory pathway component PulM